MIAWLLSQCGLLNVSILLGIFFLPGLFKKHAGRYGDKHCCWAALHYRSVILILGRFIGVF